MFTKLLTAVLVLGLVAGCGGTKMAATPAADAVLRADNDMHKLRVDYDKLAGTYYQGCDPAKRTIEISVCNAWKDFTVDFTQRYQDAGTHLEITRATGAGQPAVDAEIAKLRMDLIQRNR